MASGTGTSTETEATLVIRSEDPASIVKELAALTRLGNCLLEARESIRIHDTYFDTGPAKEKFALRIREIGRDRLITVKGPTRKTAWGALERLEIEEIWSLDSFQRAIELIRGEPPKLPLDESDYERIPPVEVMRKAGFDILQRRETYRQIREILDGIQKAAPIAGELAIDSGIYHFAELGVRHYEVEIEAKADNSADILKAVHEDMISIFGEALLPWEWNKLSTGLAVETLLGRLPEEALIDEERILLPEAYDLIDQELRRVP